MSKRLSNKTKKVREHLEAGNTITAKEAYELYYTMRLSAIIFNLREEGLNIVTLEDSNSYATYKLIQDEEVA